MQKKKKKKKKKRSNNMNNTSTNYDVFLNYKPYVNTSSEASNEMIFTIAKWFLSKESMSNKKLQKMCYYAYCWCIVFLNDMEDSIDKSICKDGFEAWIHGPVCRNLYNKYKSYGWNDIPMFDGKLNLSNQVVEVLNEVWEAYGNLTATQLESLTHSEKPWIEARKGFDFNEASTQKIDVKTIYEFYSKQVVHE